MTSEAFLEEVLGCFSKFFEQAGFPASFFPFSSSAKEYKAMQISENFPEMVWVLSKSLQKLAKQSSTEKTMIMSDPSLVQITATKAQLDQRIAAFISHAQSTVDEQNVHEFCANSQKSSSGCARANALYKRRVANQTHLQVQRVINDVGPQMQIDSQGAWCAPIHKDNKGTSDKSLHYGVEERLSNLEHHVGCERKKSPKEIYARLKAVEERVLQLESMSPEYFLANATSAPPTRSRSSSMEEKQQNSLIEIDDRIRYLKEKLLAKRFKSS
ncbi:MAP3K12-binding inhibitory protein 1-like [Clavelina lepadiformis]|uniref:MAP3K12-binding inhibitory protein 1-like n=1 Tax=Clavelina lepadiformis TaxID=159417 RepID=UPI0040424179